MSQSQLTIEDLKNMFRVSECKWTVYADKKGKVRAVPKDRVTVEQLDKTRRGYICHISGVSRRDAVLHGRRMLMTTGQ